MEANWCLVLFLVTILKAQRPVDCHGRQALPFDSLCETSLRDFFELGIPLCGHHLLDAFLSHSLIPC